MNRFEPYLPLLSDALKKLDAWRTSYGVIDKDGYEPDSIQIAKVLSNLAERLEGNYPFHHPQYAGQMLKPPHPAAWLAYTLAMTINPNNHALDGGPPTSKMEKEVVDQLAGMCGYKQPYLGHLTSAGTIANLEALFIARELHSGKAVAATAQAHYTHRRMCRVLNIPFLEIPVDPDGRPDKGFLEDHADEIGTLVVTMGTTGLGRVEPLADMAEWAQSKKIRVHVDAAYGGFFSLISDNLPDKTDWHALPLADSIVIDPHKHGLQPYGCGSVLFKDPSVGRFYKHDSPYTYFTSDDLHLGEISLECSRAGAAAAALWTTLQLIPLSKNGLGSMLQNCVNAAGLFAEQIGSSSGFRVYENPHLDIVGYFPEPEMQTYSEISTLSKSLFSSGMNDRETGFHLSLYKIPADEFSAKFPGYKRDAQTITILRSVFMKPEHKSFIPELINRLHNHL